MVDSYLPDSPTTLQDTAFPTACSKTGPAPAAILFFQITAESRQKRWVCTCIQNQLHLPHTKVTLMSCYAMHMIYTGTVLKKRNYTKCQFPKTLAKHLYSPILAKGQTFFFGCMWIWWLNLLSIGNILFEYANGQIRIRHFIIPETNLLGSIYRYLFFKEICNISDQAHKPKLSQRHARGQQNQPHTQVTYFWISPSSGTVQRAGWKIPPEK